MRIKNSSVHSLLPVQGGWVQTLFREVRPHMPCGMAKKKKKKKMVSLVPDPQLHGGEGLLCGCVTAGLGWLPQKGAWREDLNG